MITFNIHNTKYARNISECFRGGKEFIEGDQMLELDIATLELEIMQDGSFEIDIPLSVLVKIGENAKEIIDKMKLEKVEKPKSRFLRSLENLSRTRT